MTVTGLDHVQLAGPPGCEPTARAFYGELLGLPELKKPDALAPRGGVWFACGGHALHVGIEKDFRPARKAHAALRTTVAGLDELAALLEGDGHPVAWHHELTPVRRFYTTDPFGNRLELVALS